MFCYQILHKLQVRPPSIGSVRSSRSSPATVWEGSGARTCGSKFWGFKDGKRSDINLPIKETIIPVLTGKPCHSRGFQPVNREAKPLKRLTYIYVEIK